MKNQEKTIRQPIVTVVGHVDHGKTSILDCFRGSSVQEGEAGGITQKISFTKYPISQVKAKCQAGVDLELPGFLFIDTPGHAAFTNLRKRGGSLADLAVLVVNIKEGIKPQTAEVLQILKAHKTPFVIALNKVDTISGWKKKGNVKESIDTQAINVRQEFDTALLTFQGALQEHGIESDLFYEVGDFTKKVALVPCSAKTEEGIPELLLMLCGLSQKFLKERLEMHEESKGVILEVKKAKGMCKAEAIVYDGVIDEGDELVVGSLDGNPIVTKIRALEEIVSLKHNYEPKKSVRAASGVRMQLTNSDILPGMPFQEIKGKDDKEKVIAAFKKDVSSGFKLDKQGIIIKADSLGSLEALMVLLKQSNVQVLKAGIGPIGKGDIISAQANMEIDPLNAVVVGFNTEVDKDVTVPEGVKIFSEEVVYKLIEDLEIWRKEKQSEIHREKMLGLASIVKLEILHKYVFRNSNPAIFGVKVVGGEAKKGLNLIDEDNEEVARIKGLQHEKDSVDSGKEGQELAMSLPGVAFDRRFKENKYLYSQLSEKQFKEFKKNKDLLSENEKRVLMEIAEVKRKKDEGWGA